jgi:hypothetical protein
MIPAAMQSGLGKKLNNKVSESPKSTQAEMVMQIIL